MIYINYLLMNSVDLIKNSWDDNAVQVVWFYDNEIQYL